MSDPTDVGDADRPTDRHAESEKQMKAEVGSRRALEILERWQPNLPSREAGRLLASGPNGAVDVQTAQALLETLDRMSIDLALVQLALERTVVARDRCDNGSNAK